MQPIIVTIQNKLPAPRTLAWLPRGQRWLPGNGSIQLDYEPWSAGNDAQRKSLVAELNNRWLTLSISLLRADGTYAQTDYCPAGEKKAAPQQSAIMRQANTVAAPQADALSRDGKSHVVIAGGNKNIAARMGFKADSAAPDAAKQLAMQEGVGFQAQSVTAPAGNLTTAEIKANIEQASQAAEEAALEEEVPDQGPSELSVEAQFDALTADHKWADALKLLVDTYGEDRITFNTRAIMSLKTDRKSVV